MVVLVDGDELMTIGRFARLALVSVHTLRHYNEVGLLAPAEIDAASGYRRYRRTQIQDVRLIQVLRGIDLSIEQIRHILDSGTDDEVRTALAGHRSRLERERKQLAGRIERLDRFLEKGITMPIVQSGCRPVQTVLSVDDRAASVAFYREAFDFPYEVIRRTKDKDHQSFSFGEYGQDDFFLLHLHGPDRSDRPVGPASLGLLVPDVDACHAKALACGATEVSGPDGTPRTSTVLDPSGNRIGLTQSWPEFDAGCRPVRITLPVDNAERSITFYERAFELPQGLPFDFGEYGRNDFFQLDLLADPASRDRPGPSTISFLVEDLDAYHARALAAGATEVSPPVQAEGMPRGSAVRDPSGNTIGLAQG